MGEGLQFPDHVDEAVRRRFEASLAANDPQPLDMCLSEVDDSKYVATLEELVAIALECAWKRVAHQQDSPYPLSLEPYLKQFPALRRKEIMARLEQQIQEIRRELAESQVQTDLASILENTSSQMSSENSSQGGSDGHMGMVFRLAQYQIFEAIGRGGMGVVHRGLHTRLHKQVAIKILPAASWSDKALIQRFEREMRAAGQLQHPNVVIAHDAGVSNGMHYLVMELVDGIDLENILVSKQTLEQRDACRIIHDIAQALHHAHSKSLIHRDIKPSNIMLTRAGEVKLLDLGLALLTSWKSDSGDITQSKQCMGTLHYMAPEQAEDSHSVGTPADIYSLGATLYRLLSGESPHGPRNASPLRLMSALQRGEFTPLQSLVPNCQRELSLLVQRMLSRNPSDRPGTAAEVAEALVPLMAGAKLANLLDLNSNAETFLPAGPQTDDLQSENHFDNLKDMDSDNRDDARSDWFWLYLGATLLGSFLAVLAMARPWSLDAQPVFGSAASILVQFPPATAPEVKIDGWPVDGVVVQPGLLKVSVGNKNLNDLKIDVQGEGYVWSVGELREPESATTDEQLMLKAWPLLPRAQVITWVQSMGGDAILWNNKGTWTYLSSMSKTQIGEIERVTRVELNETSVKDDELWRLASLPELVELNLSKTDVSDSCLKYFANLGELLYLNLVDTKVSGPGLAYLNDLPSLSQLFLSRTVVDDEGLEHLSGARLAQLALDGTRVSPRSVSHISSMSNLRHLNLMDLGFQKHHIDAIRTSLPECEIFPAVESRLPANN